MIKLIWQVSESIMNGGQMHEWCAADKITSLNSVRYNISIMDGVMPEWRSRWRDRGVFRKEHEINMMVAISHFMIFMDINSYYSLERPKATSDSSRIFHLCVMKSSVSNLLFLSSGLIARIELDNMQKMIMEWRNLIIV